MKGLIILIFVGLAASGNSQGIEITAKVTATVPALNVTILPASTEANSATTPTTTTPTTSTTTSTTSTTTTPTTTTTPKTSTTTNPPTTKCATCSKRAQSCTPDNSNDTCPVLHAPCCKGLKCAKGLLLVAILFPDNYYCR